MLWYAWGTALAALHRIRKNHRRRCGCGLLLKKETRELQQLLAALQIPDSQLTQLRTPITALHSDPTSRRLQVVLNKRLEEIRESWCPTCKFENGIVG